MKNAKCLLISFFLLILHNLHSQSPGGVSGVLAWFTTEVNSSDLSMSKWVDIGPSQLKLKAENVPTGTDYKNKVVSVNHNPALYFDDSNTKYYFRTKKSLSRNYTVIGVFIPKQSGDHVQYIMYEGNGTLISLLKSDTYAYQSQSGFYKTYDYGEVLPNGSDLLHGSGNEHPDESDRYGKIVTTNLYATPDYCYDMGSITGKLISINSDMENYEQTQEGYLPEFIIFDRVLTEIERTSVESYLAIKYGFSKYGNYELGGAKAWEVGSTAGGCDKTDYQNRITGIGSDLSLLNQSRSTTYYDEDVEIEERDEMYMNYADYSNSKKRLLRIGIEDEKSTIRERWGINSYLIWGDNDGDLSSGDFVSLPDNTKYKRVGRIWKSQYTRMGEGSSPKVSWCNYHDLEETSTGDLKRKYDETSANDRVGICATTTSTSSSGSIHFKITQRPLGSSYGLIGFASENSKFSSEDFSYALRIESQKIYALYDTDDDGKYDLEYDMGGYNLNQEFSLSIEIGQASTKLKVNTSSSQFETDHDRENIEEHYGKLILYSDDLTLKKLVVSGFSSQPIGRTNIELAYEGVQNYFPNSKEVYLLVNDEGDTDFPDNVHTKAYKCGYSETPGDLYNKLEWYGVPMKGNCSAFTFAKKECQWEVNVGEPIYDCCGEKGTIKVEISNCPIVGIFSVIVNGTSNYHGEGDFPLNLELKNGQYSIQVISPKGEILYNETVIIANPNSSNSIEEPVGWQKRVCFTEEGQVIQIDGTIPGAGSGYTYTYSWYNPNNILISTNPILTLNQQQAQLGFYTLTVHATCLKQTCQTKSFKVEICRDIGTTEDCELMVTPNPCGGIWIRFTNPSLSNCRKLFNIVNINGIVASGSAQVNEVVYIDLHPGNYTLIWTNDDCCRLANEEFTVPEMVNKKEVCLRDRKMYSLDPLIITIPKFGECIPIAGTIKKSGIGSFSYSYSFPTNVTEYVVPYDILAKLTDCWGDLIINFDFGNDCSLSCNDETVTVYDCSDRECSSNYPEEYVRCCKPSSLEESKQDYGEQKISISNADIPSAVRIKYINPVQNQQEYSFEMEISEKSLATLHVYDSAGKLVHQDKSKEGIIHDFKVTLPVGLYILKFSYAKGDEWIKIVAQ